MVNYTPIARMMLKSPAQLASRSAANPEAAQRAVLSELLAKLRHTKWGADHNLDYQVSSYEAFASAIPVQSYDEELRQYVMRMIAGEADVLWPGRCSRFAQSSGTSGSKSKYVPITDACLRANHYGGAACAASFYLKAFPRSRLFSGKAFILGGSFANELNVPAGVEVGDLSATLIKRANPLIQYFRVPSKQVALMADWHEKLPMLVKSAAKEDVTSLSGVPSWFLTVLKEVLAFTGASSIREVWPNLEVFFHGGIAFGPYRQEYEEVIGSRICYWENYNASEGFFACTDREDNPEGAMLMLDNIGVFYEFLPLGQENEPFPEALPIWKVQPGRTYSLVITSCNGLVRYALGDTVKVVSVDPVRIVIAGRTKSYINAFGEEVMVYNTDAALAKACAAFGCSVVDYTAAPVFAKGKQKGRHQWLIEWSVQPSDIEAFADMLDRCLQEENSDYQAKRQGSIFLDRLEVISAPSGAFDAWLESTGRLGGQRKVPRLSNDRNIIEQIQSIKQENHKKH